MPADVVRLSIVPSRVIGSSSGEQRADFDAGVTYRDQQFWFDIEAPRNLLSMSEEEIYQAVATADDDAAALLLQAIDDGAELKPNDCFVEQDHASTVLRRALSPTANPS